MSRILLTLLVLAAQAAALDTSNLRPQGYVSDFAEVINPQQRAAIEAYCGNVERSTGAQFAVVTVKSLEDEPIEDVAVRLFREWGIGNRETDEGLLFLLAVEDRKQRIETGYGVEPYVTDGFAGGVMRSIRPMLRQGDYGAALYAAVQQLGDKIAQGKGVTIEGAPPMRQRDRTPGGIGIGGIVGGIILLLFLASLFGGGRRGGGGRGGRGGRGGGRGGGDLLTGLIIGSMIGRHGGGSGGGWSHGGFGGSSGGFGGGGFGGFGGGSSGGGGASGSW